MPFGVPIGDLSAVRKLPLISWRGIQFPIARLETDFEQDIAEHRKPDRDGAKLEATGRGPIVTSGVALFYNGIVFDLSANTSSPLFPDVHKAFLLACADRTTDTLMHPILGSMQAKCKNLKSVLDAARADGAQVQVTWREHVDDDSTLGEAAPLATASIEAGNVDSALAALRIKNAALDAQLKAIDPKLSFTDSLRQIQAASDTVALLQKQGAAIIPRVQYNLGKVQDSLNALGTVTVHNTRESVERLKAALYALQQALFATKKIALYTVPSDATIASIASTLGRLGTDLVRLNPALVAAASVKRGTAVRYYA